MTNPTPVLSKPVEENMLDRETLQKALDKAVKNGHPDWGMPRGFAIYSVIFSHGFARAFWGDRHTCFICGDDEVESGETHNSNGDDYWSNCHGCGAEWMDKHEFEKEGNYGFAWEYHLQQMVLEENPIKYLEKYL